ncbi:hypothetical protein [Dubosiella newyorkensis]|uniref:hypothetical protein n=1 Tax=Dubosiella newyorkensis TaxID=1862672 RepID=UPI003F67CBFC
MERIVRARPQQWLCIRNDNRSRYLCCRIRRPVKKIQSIPDASDRLYEVEIRGMKPVIAMLNDILSRTSMKK